MNREEALKKRADRLELISSAFELVVIVLYVVIWFASGWLAENYLYYYTEEEVTRSVSYDHPVGTVDTYICYTTNTGRCYHSGDCGSLWNSKHETTVYQAKQDGYVSCERCSPYVPTTLTLTEKRYREETHTERIRKEPKVMIAIISWIVLTVVWYLIYRITDKRLKEVNQELAKIKSGEL